MDYLEKQNLDIIQLTFSAGGELGSKRTNKKDDLCSSVMMADKGR